MDGQPGRSQAVNTLLAYRRVVEGIGARLALLEDLGELGDVGLADLERPALRAAVASWASDHAAASVRRAHSAWSSLFDFLVAEGVRDGNPMAAIPKPKTPVVLPRAIRARDAIGRLLRAATEPDARSRQPWPARDLALVATFCVTGIREAEAVSLDIGSLSGEPGARRLEVRGKGGKARPIPIDALLDGVLSEYQGQRIERFPEHDLDHPSTPLFVDVRGRRLSVDQVRYLIDRLYVRPWDIRHRFRRERLFTPCATPSRPRLWKPAPTWSSCRSCSATPAWRPLAAISPLLGRPPARHPAHPNQAALRAAWRSQ